MSHIALEGIFNLRDLGGYATGDGHVVRTGCLFRSDELHALTEADLDAVAQLGVRVVYDLRNQFERDLRPNPTLGGVVVHERQAPPQDTSGMTMEEKVAAGIPPVQADDDEFGDVYIALLTYLNKELRHIVELASDARDNPLLFHCVAGKDRTGITAAVLLGLLGVDDETILDDYELTTSLWTPKRMEQLADLIAEHDLDEENLRLTVSARRPVLAKALRYLHDTWDTFDAYASDALGVAPEVIDRLRASLLVWPTAAG
jgi:protein-tyrosine phosphatase